MGKADRNRRQSAREKIAAQQAAAKRAERRRQALLVGGSIVVVIAVVVAFIVLKKVNAPASTASSGGAAGTTLSASTIKDVTNVPASTLDAVGEGTSLSYNPTPISTISNTKLTSGGKPEMLYIGAEFCPYCGAMRWSMAVALGRFGTFTTPLHGIHSSRSDTDPSTPTLTFYKSSYSSKYLVFTPVENETISHGALQNTTAEQLALWKKYDSSATGLGYPFIDFGNKYVIKDPMFDPGILKGMTWAQVASALQDPSSQVAKNADGAANMITAAICKMTGNSPASVCTSSAVTAGAKAL